MKKQDKALEQAQELVSKMTIEEAASQLFYQSPAIERLGIPAYNWWNEALHGVARAGTATMFPQAISLAAMFDPDQIREMAETTGIEARAKYNIQAKYDDRDIYKGVTMWSPNINIFRDPRWGRGHETYGEDPYLTATLGKAFVEGLQGDGEYMRAAACAKHFAVHSGPENIRHSFNAVCSQKDMNETYLPAFEALIRDAKVEGVMGCYNRINGECGCASDYLTDKLKEWGFDGYFTSDAWALRDFYQGHAVCEDVEQAAALALSKGCDTNCGDTYPCLMDAYRHGLVTEEQIRTACVHLFRTRFRLGLFDENNGFGSLGLDDIATPEHRAAALKCAEKGMVLLKNNGILPLDKTKLKSVAVIGPNAESLDALRGNYFGTSAHPVTFLDGIREELGSEVKLYYSEGCHLHKDRVEHLAMPDDRITEALAMTEKADVTILFLGLDATIEGEEGDEGNAFVGGDKLSLELPAPQKKLLKKVLSVGKPVILVLAAGSSLNAHAEGAAAILQAWYPGETGGTALANILFGKVSPSGKLPVTFYESATKLPDFLDYSMKNRTYRYAENNVLYPFGYGLTYSTVSLRDMTFDGKNVGITIQNTGDFDTDEVLQVYVRDCESPLEVRNYRLCGFMRVSLSKGESLAAEIPLDKNTFTLIDEEGNRVPGSGKYQLWCGISQPDALSESLTSVPALSIGYTTAE
ncbi:MAG: glycoside hydrolase family 3 C-terminal domain-containing protein [Anaerolineaceae bacterium]|nr:glycoside hydrolase family 3 C-terminal domain-containing protein [Anaerolineaceae bacterium]